MTITPQRRRLLLVINAVALTACLGVSWRSGDWLPAVGVASSLVGLVMAANRAIVDDRRSQ